MEYKKQKGSALLMLLVVVAIGLIIYYMDISWMGGGNRMIQKQEKPEDQPWAKENLIRDSNHPSTPAKKSAAEPNILADNEPVTYNGIVVSKETGRGTITLTVQPTGTVTGGWQCQYSYTHAAYEITAAFKGNTLAKQNGYKPGDLYLVAKGDFVQKETNLESGEITETKGMIYINGQRSLNDELYGTLSITTNKKWHADYTWKAGLQ